MPLKEQLTQDLQAAMRARDETRLNAIRGLKTAISYLEIARTDSKNKDFNKPVTEADMLAVVEKQIKQRRESIEMYEKGNRPELAATEAAEIAVLQVYLPKQLTPEEIGNEVQALIAELGTKEFPKVMRAAAARLKGRADGKTVSEIVKELTAS